jgi:RNA polymerase sigma factor (sigma-70 family)
MTATLNQNEALSDAELVAESRRGNREAFGRIVQRYQGMVTGVIYCLCGDFHRSEDLAQETFISAWKSLSGIDEPEKLSPWLCQIARRKALDSLRAASREKNHLTRLFRAPPIPEAATPPQEALAEEERELLWRNLSKLPEPYRQTLVLYYRQEKSAAAVALALETTEESVRQRLARGREMLREQIAQTLEQAIVRSAPGPAFAPAVLAALPIATTAAKAAGAGAAAKSAGLLGVCNALLTPVFTFVSLYFSFKLDRDSARSEPRREFVVKFYRVFFALFIGLFAAELTLLFCARLLMKSHRALFAGLEFGLAAACVLVAALSIVWMQWRRRNIFRQEISRGCPAPALAPLFEYCSKLSLFGLPLVHIRLRGGRTVKAWIAAGDGAIGVIFAFGGLAIAPISVGGISIGFCTLGGFALGLAALGGFCLAPWAIGAFAVGLQSLGPCALAWTAASGEFTAAHGFATGIVALAPHANDHAAWLFIANSTFFKAAQTALRYVYWVNLILLLSPALWFWNRKKGLQTKTG